MLDILGCTRDNDIYGDVLSELRAMLPHAYALLEPVALVEIGEFAGVKGVRYIALHLQAAKFRSGRRSCLMTASI